MSSSSNLSSILIQHLENDKEKFLSDLRSDIRKKISSKSPAECLEIVTIREGKSVKWYISEGVPYIKRLVSYLRKKNYDEDGRIYEVDSALTSEILDVVTKKMTSTIEKHQDLIADMAIAEIFLNEATQQQFINVLLQGKSVKIINAKGKSMIAAALLNGIQQKFHNLSSSIASQFSDKVTQALAIASKSTIASNVTSIATKIIASAGGKVILTKLSIVIGKSLAPLIAKILAMPAIKIALKKIIVAAVISSMAKFISAKIGMSIGAAIWVVLIPVIAYFLIKDIIELPDKLSVAISDAVTSDIRSNYTKTMSEIVTGLIANLTSNSVIEEIGKNLGDDPEVAKELSKLIAVVAEGATN